MGFSDHEREIKFNIDADECVGRWNPPRDVGRGEDGRQSGNAEGGGRPETDPPRVRVSRAPEPWWNRDKNANLRRGDPGPSTGTGLGGLEAGGLV